MKRFVGVLYLCFVPAFAADDGSSAAASAGAAALSWLVSARRPDGGWGSDTAAVVTALNLANSSSRGLSRADRQLAEKQLQIELLAAIWRQHQSPVTPVRLAEYVTALVSACVDATRFQGKDLTAMMRHRVAADDSALVPVELASCLAGAPLRRRNYLRLLTTVEGDRAANASTETLALAVLALHCMEARGDRRAERHITEVTRRLAGRQRADGSFGDLYTTLMAHQALRAEAAVGWDPAASLHHILSYRRPDGSLGDVRMTAVAVGVLAGRSLLHVTDTPCHRRGGASEAGAPLPSVGGRANSKLPPPPPPSPSQVTLWLWIGSRPDLVFRQLVSVQPNASVFECLQLAAQLNSRFQFSSELWPNGHYIHTIGGYREQKDGYRFWLLYSLTSPPDPAHKPTQMDVHGTGVDRLVPPDGGHVLFWYREV